MRTITALCSLLLASNLAFAGIYIDESETHKQKQSQDQGQAQGQLQGQAQGQIGINKQGQSQRAYGGSSDQGQYQGNLGIQKGNDTNTSTNVSVSGDDGDEVKAYSFSAPGLSANKGVSEGNFYSVFGGIGISSTEEYQLAIDRFPVTINNTPSTLLG